MNWQDWEQYICVKAEKFFSWYKARKLFKKKQQKRKNPIIDWIQVILEVIVIVLLINMFLFQNYKIPSPSMVPELVEEAGGEIVIEEICEGMKYYWNNIERNGDLFKSLTMGYLVDRVPCAFMRESAPKRLVFTLELIKDFTVAGVIWYELLCCETYDSESYYFSKKLAEKNIPMLILESDYGSSATGQLKTRIEAFIEIVKGVM